MRLLKNSKTQHLQVKIDRYLSSLKYIYTICSFYEHHVQIDLPEWALIVVNFLFSDFLLFESFRSFLLKLFKHYNYHHYYSCYYHWWRVFSNSIDVFICFSKIICPRGFALAFSWISNLKFWMVSFSDSFTSYFVTIYLLKCSVLLMLVYFLLSILVFTSFSYSTHSRMIEISLMAK